MHYWIVVFLSMSLAACASPEIRCDRKLTAINAPGGSAVVPRGASGKKP